MQQLKDSLGRSLVENSAEFLEEEQNHTAKASPAVNATLLGAIIEHSSTERGAKDIMKMAKNTDPNIADKLDQLFSRSPQTVNGLMNLGVRDMSLFMDKRGRGVTNIISETSGIRKQSTSSLMKLSTPFIMSLIAKEVQEKNLDINGLKSFLNGQKSQVSSDLPSGMVDAMELSSFGWVKKDEAAEERRLQAERDKEREAQRAEKEARRKEKEAKRAEKEAARKREAADKLAAKTETVEAASTASATTTTKKKAGFGLWGCLIPLLLIGLLGFFLFKSGCFGASDHPGYTTPVEPRTQTQQQPQVQTQQQPPQVKTQQQPQPKAQAQTQEQAQNTNPIQKALGSIDQAAATALNKIKFAAGSVGSQMMDFVKGGAKGEGKFRFNNLNFASGSAQISGNSGLEVDNLAAILKAYKDVKIAVHGYTDNTGNAEANQKLSRQRADAVKNRLVQLGIQGKRISTQGFGDANPVADNGTAEGRAQNRRIEVVIQK